MCYNEQKSKLRSYTNPSNKIERQLFGILNLGHCDLPFDLAQGGGELVEPFVICLLGIVI